VLSAAIIKPLKTYDLNLRKLDLLKNISSLSSLKKGQELQELQLLKKGSYDYHQAS
jgi:hypothetical protein